MKDNKPNVFGYIDDLTEEELLNLQDQLVDDIEYLKEIKDRKNSDFEIERLRYVKKVLKEINTDQKKKL